MFHNKVPKKLFGPKMDEVTREQRRLRNEERYDLCSSTSIIRVIKSRRMRWVGHVARMGERKGAYRVLMGRPGGKRPLGRTKRRWRIILIGSSRNGVHLSESMK